MAALSSRDRSPVKTPRRRRQVDSARRDDLLASIQQIFLDEGFTTVTIGELAERLHCSRATLYSVASTKEQLVVLATKEFFRSSAQLIERRVSEHHDPRQRILVYLDGVAEAMRRNSPAFYDDMVAFAPTAAIYARNTERAAARVRELIDEGIADGQFRSADGNFAAHLVALAIEGVQSGALLERTGMTAADAFAELGTLLLDGLIRRPS
ncbi:TetR/AcrR family transcriptional regulator [Nocardia sp. alder85J]|uniref:TetR/AcrR family transcriptional regulator n=1 Tax=Nocardia sp. alder85J TaxID=2862949 RepID=UPI002107585B|nr:TetR/AcrR family transcriptional regulator [Nocardia sp. alder85J]MCX4095702.1 TetR/AcrR family transcriptional regulator [Nocardia sp. alder85J]